MSYRKGHQHKNACQVTKHYSDTNMCKERGSVPTVTQEHWSSWTRILGTQVQNNTWRSCHKFIDLLTSFNKQTRLPLLCWNPKQCLQPPFFPEELQNTTFMSKTWEMLGVHHNTKKKKKKLQTEFMFITSEQGTFSYSYYIIYNLICHLLSRYRNNIMLSGGLVVGSGGQREVVTASGSQAAGSRGRLEAAEITVD